MSYMHHICGLKISIHAPRAGSDNIRPNLFATLPDFNPRSPCGERLDLRGIKIGKYIFQSTLPVRGATKSIMEIATLASISIHAPRAGSDPRAAKKRPLRGRFQSTLPVRGATAAAGWNCAVEADFNPRSPCGERRTTGEEAVIPMLISIHAPRAGSDTTAR